MNRLAIATICLAVTYAQAAPLPALPATPTSPATDTYFNTTVKDPYRWLENTADHRVHAWSVAQDAHTRAYLDALPIRAQIHDRLMALMSKTSPSFSGLVPAGNKVFASFVQPPKQQPMIALLGPDADPATARIILDPNVLDPTGHTEFDWFVPSPDGTKIAVSLSQNGSEDGTLHVVDVATGKDTGLTIPRVQYPTAGGSLAWRRDSTGFWYTRYPGPDAPEDHQHFYQQVYYHKLDADPAHDTYVAGKDFPKVAEIMLDNRQSPGPVLMSAANGDGGEFSQYLIAPDNTVHQVSTFADQAVAAQIGPDGTLYLLSHRNAARGKILALPAGDTNLADARTLIPQNDGIIDASHETGLQPFAITDRAIYLRQLVGGPSRITAYALKTGKRLPDLPLPALAAVSEIEPLSGHEIYYQVATYLRPPYYEQYNELSSQAAASQLAETSPIHFDDATVTRVFAKSKDGTQIPLNIIAPTAAKRNATNPTQLYGYGGYHISEVPHFLGASGRIWLDANGILAFANLRGGGEYGETWHDQGALAHKQNVFDDFYACAQYLVRHGWTSPAKLAARGGSNGGLLMGAMITQHPAEFRAIVSQVGLYDMLRTELDPNGTFNISEYGTVKNPAQFAALYAYSPYHHVVPGTKYPAIFMATGEHDGRVNPMHSRKMIAALQAADSAGAPILLSINTHAGHGHGSALSIRVDQTADYEAFLFDQLGMSLQK